MGINISSLFENLYAKSHAGWGKHDITDLVVFCVYVGNAEKKKKIEESKQGCAPKFTRS